MIKDTQKYAAPGGWGVARWLGQAQRAYGKGASFAMGCFGCPIPEKDND